MASVRSTQRSKKEVARSARATKNAAPVDALNSTLDDRIAEDVQLLRDGLLFWFYDRRNMKRAKLYADLLANLLPDVGSGSIVAEECRSLVAELRGEWGKAISHRQKEIALIRHLHEISIGEPGEEFVFECYDYADLSDRLDLLATLYHSAGKLGRAIAVLEESKALCEAHKIEFDGGDLLEEYLAEASLAKRATA